MLYDVRTCHILLSAAAAIMNALRLMLIAAQASHISSNSTSISGSCPTTCTKHAHDTGEDVMQQQQIVHTGATSISQLNSSLVQVRAHDMHACFPGNVSVQHEQSRSIMMRYTLTRVPHTSKTQTSVVPRTSLGHYPGRHRLHRQTKAQDMSKRRNLRCRAPLSCPSSTLLKSWTDCHRSLTISRAASLPRVPPRLLPAPCTCRYPRLV